MAKIQYEIKQVFENYTNTSISEITQKYLKWRNKYISECLLCMIAKNRGPILPFNLNADVYCKETAPHVQVAKYGHFNFI